MAYSVVLLVGQEVRPGWGSSEGEHRDRQHHRYHRPWTTSLPHQFHLDLQEEQILRKGLPQILQSIPPKMQFLPGHERDYRHNNHPQIIPAKQHQQASWRGRQAPNPAFLPTSCIKCSNNNPERDRYLRHLPAGELQRGLLPWGEFHLSDDVAQNKRCYWIVSHWSYSSESGFQYFLPLSHACQNRIDL